MFPNSSQPVNNHGLIATAYVWETIKMLDVTDPHWKDVSGL